MSDTKLNRSRLIEVTLTLGIAAGIVLMLFPNIWKPFLQSWDHKPAKMENGEPMSQLEMPSTSISMPKPHWVDGNAKIASIKGAATGFRTNVESNGDFRNREEPREVITTTELPKVSILENPAPKPPTEEWEIHELAPELENGLAIQEQTDPEYYVPQLRPSEISDEVVGEVTPLITEPDYARENQFAGDMHSSFMQEPLWWLEQIQQPQIADRVPQSISLDQVILMALQQAPEVQVLNTEPEVRRTVIDQSIARFDWSTFVETVWTDTNEPVGSLLTTGRAGGRFLQQEFAFEGGMKKKLATGGDLRVGQNFGRLDNNSDNLSPQDQNISRLVIDYRQPLMQGAGQRYATTQIVLAKLDFEQVQSQSLGLLQNYIVEVVSAYWKLYQARATLVQYRRSLERAEELSTQIGNTANDQVVRAEAAISARRTDVIRAEYEVLNAQDRLVNLTVGPDAEESRFTELIPEPMSIPEHYTSDSEALTYVALRNRPEVTQAVAKIKSASALEYVAINELLPKLDAILSTYVSGLQGGSLGRSAFGSQFSTGDPSYSIGFGFELPVGNRVAKSKLQRQKLQTRIFSQQFQKTVGDVVLDVRVSSRNLERLQAEIQNNLQAFGKARQAMESISQRQQSTANDRQTSSLYIEDLLAAQSRLTLAEQRLLASRTEYAIGLIDLKRATGELVNGKHRADQYLPQAMEGEIIVAAPIDQPAWSQPAAADVQGNFLPNQPSGDFVPSGKRDSVEVTPEVIEWNSETD